MSPEFKVMSPQFLLRLHHWYCIRNAAARVGNIFSMQPGISYNNAQYDQSSTPNI